jgi:hypothetical protein
MTSLSTVAPPSTVAPSTPSTMTSLSAANFEIADSRTNTIVFRGLGDARLNVTNWPAAWTTGGAQISDVSKLSPAGPSPLGPTPMGPVIIDPIFKTTPTGPVTIPSNAVAFSLRFKDATNLMKTDGYFDFAEAFGIGPVVTFMTDHAGVQVYQVRLLPGNTNLQRAIELFKDGKPVKDLKAAGLSGHPGPTHDKEPLNTQKMLTPLTLVHVVQISERVPYAARPGDTRIDAWTNTQVVKPPAGPVGPVEPKYHPDPTEATFDYDFYRANSPPGSPLRDAKKWSNKQLWNHFIKNGKAGGWAFRVKGQQGVKGYPGSYSVRPPLSERPKTPYASATKANFDFDYYRAQSPPTSSLRKLTNDQIWTQWVTEGQKAQHPWRLKGQIRNQASEKPADVSTVTAANFDYAFYKANAPAGSAIKTMTNAQVWAHWNKHGKAENRAYRVVAGKGTAVAGKGTAVAGKPTAVAGKPSAVAVTKANFDYDFYRTHSLPKSKIRKFTNDQVWNHWTKHGKAEKHPFRVKPGGILKK